MLLLQLLPVQRLRANVSGPGKIAQLGDAGSSGFRYRVQVEDSKCVFI